MRIKILLILSLFISQFASADDIRISKLQYDAMLKAIAEGHEVYEYLLVKESKPNLMLLSSYLSSVALFLSHAVQNKASGSMVDENICGIIGSIASIEDKFKKNLSHYTDAEKMIGKSSFEMTIALLKTVKVDCRNIDVGSIGIRNQLREFKESK